MNQTAIKTYIVSVLLVELLDDLEGTSAYKHKVKFHAKQLAAELTKLNDVQISGDELTQTITNALNAIDDVL